MTPTPRRVPLVEPLELRLLLHGGHHHDEPTEPVLTPPPVVVSEPAAATTTAPVTTSEPVSSFVDSHLTYDAASGQWRNMNGVRVDPPTTSIVSGKKTTTTAAATGPVAASGVATAYTTGAKKILIIRIRFLDQYQSNASYEPQSLSSTQTMLSDVNTFLLKNSFGATWVDLTNSVVSPVYTFANTAAWYSTNDTSGIATNVRVDAMSLAANPAASVGLAAANSGLAAYNYANFDQYAVRYVGGPGGFSGQAYVGSTGTWLKSSSAGVAAHEFGHNLGLWHANAWVPSQPITVIGPGSNNEYGEGPDTMGGAGGGNNAFNAYEKWQLGWLGNTNITTATSSGVYRVYAHDLGGSLQSGISYALRTTRDSDRDYWISVRQSLTSNQWLMNGVQVHWDPWASSAGGSHILDTTPFSPDGVNDAGLTLGRTFSDASGFHFTVIGKGSTTFGAAALPYFDIQLNLGTFAADQGPTGSLAASATTVATGTSVTFTATATDPDGDTLSYAWDFGDKTVGANAPIVTKSWNTAGDYRVRVTISDMLGRSYSTSLIIRVGTPANLGRISGLAVDLDGGPLAEVLVTNGLSTSDTNYRYAYTDSNGTYTLLGLTVGNSYTVNAYKAGQAVTAQFTNPVQAGTSTTGINFVAAQTSYKISGKVTDFGGSGVRGVLISDGTRTEVTDSSGNYTFWSTQLGGYTLTATKAGYQFNVSGFTNPVSVNYADATNINFTEASYTISGQITGVSSATGLSVTDGIRTATVFRQGNGGNATYRYSLTVPLGTWNLRVLDTNATPGSYTPGFVNPVTVTTGDVTSRNFVKDATTTYAVTGRVTDLGDGLAGATVTVGGQTGTTDGRGYYYVRGLSNGAYTVSVAMNGYTFSPATRSVTISSPTSPVAAGDFATTRTNPAPTVATAASATPNPVVSGKTVKLSALGTDNDGEPYLTYTWSTPTAPGGASTTYSANSSSGAKTTTATLSRAGTYVFRVTIKDVYGATATSDVTVVVSQSATSATVLPAAPVLTLHAAQQFTATLLDQFGQAMSSQPTFSWSATGGSISATGLYSATAYGAYSVTAASGTISASTAVSVPYPVGTGTGILREWWDGVTGSTVGNLNTVINAGTAPTGSQIIDSTNGGYFEIPTNRGDSYGTRLRGYYIAPATGTYYFYISSDDSSQLWMNLNGMDPVGKTKIAEVSGNTGVREWTKYATQKSVAINLVAGQWYYIEALHKENTGGDHLAVRADMPGNVSETPIPYHRLAPFTTAPNQAPTIATAAAASPTPVTGTTTTLTALGGDDAGETGLTYTWATAGTPPAAVAFSANGTNAAKSVTATFSKAGTYDFQVTVTDIAGLFVTSAVTATVNQTLTGLSVSPATATVAAGATQQFSAAGSDQFGAAMAGGVGSVVWSLVSGSPGSVDASGVYTAPTTGGGAATIKATSGALTGQAQVLAGNVLFGDNFEAGTSQWTATSGGTGAYTAVTDGTRRYQTAHTNTGVVNRATAGDTSWSNYSLQATYKITDNSLGGNASLMARVQDDSHWYGFTYDKALAKWKIYYKNGANTVDLATGPAATLTTGTDYLLRVDVNGTALRLYVNNVLQVSATDAQYANGKIGWTSFQATATLDNVSVIAIPAAPVVSSVQINDGNVQRSMVNSITYAFSSAVAISAGAFTLVRPSDASTFGVTATMQPDGRTWVLTFSGTGITAGSLADGVYELSVDASKITDVFSQQLLSPTVLSFHRLFGDSDGDRDVDSVDSLRFKQAQGSVTGGTAYRWWFDFDGDGDVDSVDSLRFKQRQGTLLP